MLKAPEIIRRLSESQVYLDYEKAFGSATKLPLTLRPEIIWQPALRGKKNENPFCALMSKSNRSCAACLQVQEELLHGPASKTHTLICFAGLYDTVIPLSVGGTPVGWLQTGQVALHPPSKAGFSKLSRQLLRWGTNVDLAKLEDAYFHGRLLSRPRYEAMVRLLEIFAQHLSLIANQCLVQTDAEESPLIARAKKIIRQGGEKSLSLPQMAKILNVSTFYFCKKFKKATGLTFTDYLARTRIERAKNLLLNPNVRISEVGYESGFTSITHFNRVFKRVTGRSPSHYRAMLPAFKSGG
jgi:AraC-like DNA-binding protein